jgi:hypothetical protein
MDRQRVETSVLSVLGTFCWIEVQPPEASGPVCRPATSMAPLPTGSGIFPQKLSLKIKCGDDYHDVENQFRRQFAK